MPVRIEVDDPDITAVWPLASKVEIIKELSDGSAEVQVYINSGMRTGRISAETYASRRDWKLNLRARVGRIIKAVGERRRREPELAE